VVDKLRWRRIIFGLKRSFIERLDPVLPRLSLQNYAFLVVSPTSIFGAFAGLGFSASATWLFQLWKANRVLACSMHLTQIKH